MQIKFCMQATFIVYRFFLCKYKQFWLYILTFIGEIGNFLQGKIKRNKRISPAKTASWINLLGWMFRVFRLFIFYFHFWRDVWKISSEKVLESIFKNLTKKVKIMYVFQLSSCGYNRKIFIMSKKNTTTKFTKHHY